MTQGQRFFAHQRALFAVLCALVMTVTSGSSFLWGSSMNLYQTDGTVEFCNVTSPLRGALTLLCGNPTNSLVTKSHALLHTIPL